MTQNQALAQRIRVRDIRGKSYKVTDANYSPLAVTLDVEIEPQITPDLSPINEACLMAAKIVDGRGSVYAVKEIEIEFSSDIEYSLVFKVEPEKKPTAKMVDLDKMAKYTFDCMVAEGMINPDFKLGAVKDLIDGCIKTAAYFFNADPDAQCEATTK